MRRNTVKKIFIGFLILLPLQYAVIGIVGVIQSEPWPAFVLPAFKSVFSSRDHIAVNHARFFVENKKNDARTEILPGVLFKGIKRSQLAGFLRTHFADSQQVSALDEEARLWLKGRLSQYYPSLEPDALHIQWSKERFHFTESGLKHDSAKIMNQFSLSLPSE